jgi:hypothetical protein
MRALLNVVLPRCDYVVHYDYIPLYPVVHYIRLHTIKASLLIFEFVDQLFDGIIK